MVTSVHLSGDQQIISITLSIQRYLRLVMIKDWNENDLWSNGFAPLMPECFHWLHDGIDANNHSRATHGRWLANSTPKPASESTTMEGA